MKSFVQRLSQIIFYPIPLRILFFKLLLRKLKSVKYSTRLEFDAVIRPNYGFCMYNAALLAKALGIKRISAIEFGVAGGNGLVNMEQHAKEISLETGIEFEIYGFDMGSGLPEPLDYRDMPYMWSEGFYKMDIEKLQNRLTKATLVIGNVAQTCTTFFSEYKPAPIGCALFDLDYYSSTIDALKIFEQEKSDYLPRVYFYFDDIASGGLRAMNTGVGVFKALEEYNELGKKKILKIEGLSTTRRVKSSWHGHMYVLHDFHHQEYNTFIGNPHQSIPLED